MYTTNRIHRSIGPALLIAALVATFSGQAVAEPQSVRVGTAEFMSPSAADGWFFTQDTTQNHTNGLGSTQRPLEIQELARALGKGRYTQTAYAQVVFQYIYNNIETEFRFGMSKGGVGALLDQSGTPFDQAQLMVDLLREGGITTATYQTGVIALDSTEFSDWTGITNATAACRLLADGGIAGELNSLGTVASCAYSGNVSAAKLHHIWVSATVDGVPMVFDPSYKKHTLEIGVALATALQCGTGCAGTITAAALLSSAQGTLPATYVANVNTTAVGNQLRTYAANLRSYIETNNRFAKLEDIVGGRIIDQSAMPTAFAALPYDSAPAPLRTWSEIPDTYRTRVNLRFDAIDKLVFGDEVYGNLIDLLLFTGTGSGTGGGQPRTVTLALIANVDGVATGITLGTGNRTDGTTTNDQFTFVMNHPYYAKSGAAAAFGTYMDDTLIQETISQFNDTPTVLYHHLTVIFGLGDTGPGYVSHVAGLRGTLSSSTFNLSANWQLQRTRAMSLVGQVNGAYIQHHHSLGFVNYPFAGESYFAFNAETALSVVQTANDASLRQGAIFAATAVSSGLEGGVAEQMFNSWDGGSSVTMFGLANEKGFRFYDATSANIGNIFAASSNYNSVQQSAITSYLSSPAPLTYRAIVPDGGSIGDFENPSGQIATWQNMPFLAYTPAGERVAYISGRLMKGGGSIAPQDPSGTIETALKNLGPAKLPTIKFSVDLASGQAAVTPAPDLVTGVGDFPHSLSFQREYHSSDAETPRTFLGHCDPFVPCQVATDREGVLPTGWSHNWQIWAEFTGDGIQGLGSDSALDASMAIAALYTISDLHKGTPTFQQRLSGIFVAN
ncbi:MAG: hypothetical protein ABI885_27165, partial [Gammaproteobacteria bacterium]